MHPSSHDWCAFWKTHPCAVIPVRPTNQAIGSYKPVIRRHAHSVMMVSGLPTSRALALFLFISRLILRIYQPAPRATLSIINSAHLNPHTHPFHRYFFPILYLDVLEVKNHEFMWRF
jgi:hypothetical protein